MADLSSITASWVTNRMTWGKSPADGKDSGLGPSRLLRPWPCWLLQIQVDKIGMEGLEGPAAKHHHPVARRGMSG